MENSEELLYNLQYNKNGSQAFDAIYRAYNKRMWIIAFKIVRDHQAAEDIVQIMFEQLLNMKDHTTIEKLEPFLHTLCRNAALKYLKANRLSYRETEELFTEENAGQENQFQANFELRVELLTALKSLPAQQSLAFQLNYLHDLDIKTVAELMHIAIRTAKMHIALGKKTLQKKLRHLRWK